MIRQFFGQARLHLSLAEAPPGPVEALKPTSAPQPITNIHSRPAAPAMIVLAAAPFKPSPLNADTKPTPAQIDTIAALYRNPIVQRAAGEARVAYLRAVEYGAFRGFVNCAIAAAGDDLSPERVATVLKRMTEDAEAALSKARADQAEHDHIVKTRRDHLQPLRDAVSHRLCALQTEMNVLIQRADSLRRAPVQFANSAQSRLLMLQAAGISQEQMVALNLNTAPDREHQREQIQARIAEVKALMQPLRTFGETGDESALAGMAEFEPLIAARRATEATPNF